MFCRKHSLSTIIYIFCVSKYLAKKCINVITFLNKKRRNFIFRDNKVKYFVNTCVFKYSVTKHEFVSLFFSLCHLFFACLEECCYYIRAYDDLSTLYPLLGEIRDYTNKQFSSSNNDLTVLFYSDGSVSRISCKRVLCR